MMRRPASGFTLIEVILAAALLGIGMVVVLFGLSQCLNAIRTSARLQEVQWVLGLGEAAYPLVERFERTLADPERELAVAPDGTLADGYRFERIVEADEEETGLFLVRTRVSWGAGDESYEEIVRYLWHPE